MNKIAVISGGGSYGAYHVGTLFKLNEKFDAVFGTSTGALMAPFAALGQYEKLIEAYADIDQYDVFNGYWTNPIKKNGKINIAKSLLRIARGKKSIGATDKALTKTIKKFYTPDMHQLIAGMKDVIVNVVNLRQTKSSLPIYINGKKTGYDNFIQAMRASASFPLLMNSVSFDNMELVDGGLSETASVIEAMKLKPKEVHVFVHSKAPFRASRTKELTKNIFHMAARVIGTLIDEVKQNDLNEEKIKEAGKKYGVRTVHLHYMHKLYTHRLVFNKEEMQQMIKDGMNHKVTKIINV